MSSFKILFRKPRIWFISAYCRHNGGKFGKNVFKNYFYTDKDADDFKEG